MKINSNLSDEEIVKKILNGEKELFHFIVKRYEDKLSRYVIRITNKKDVVDDVLQNVFIKTYKNLYYFNNDLKFSSWIYRITHNEALNFVNSSFIKKFISLNFFYNFGSFDENDERIDDVRKIEKLKTLIDKLDLKYREPLYLFYFEEKSYEEISDILRIPIKSVGTLIHRAKLKIKNNFYEKK